VLILSEFDLTHCNLAPESMSVKDISSSLQHLHVWNTSIWYRFTNFRTFVFLDNTLFK